MYADCTYESPSSWCWKDRHCVYVHQSCHSYFLSRKVNSPTALRQALQTLGYVDTYHMMSASVENPPDCLMWRDALIAKYDGVGEFGRKEWDQLLGHCQVAHHPCDPVNQEDH
jgi:hypothetical protein